MSRPSASRTAAGNGVGPGVRRFWEAIATRLYLRGLARKVAGDQQAAGGYGDARLGRDGLVADAAGVPLFQALTVERPPQAVGSHAADLRRQRDERNHFARFGGPRLDDARPQEPTLVA